MDIDFMQSETAACGGGGAGSYEHIDFLLNSIPTLSRIVLGEEEAQEALEKPISRYTTKLCEECNGINTKLEDKESGCYVCSECGLVEQFVDNSEENNREFGKELNPPQFTYKRANHFSDWLVKCSGQESTVVPHDVICGIKAERIRNCTTGHPTKKEIRKILRVLKAAKFSENVQQIINTVTRKPCEQFTGDEMYVLKSMFHDMQSPFTISQKELAPHRKNFLSYEYVIHKCCQLRGWDKFLPMFKLLKSKTKLKTQDALWKHMCNQLHWQFIPSV